MYKKSESLQKQTKHFVLCSDECICMSCGASTAQSTRVQKCCVKLENPYSKEGHLKQTTNMANQSKTTRLRKARAEEQQEHGQMEGQENMYSGTKWPSVLSVHLLALE